MTAPSRKVKLPGVFYPVASNAAEVSVAAQAGARFIQLRLKQPDRKTALTDPVFIRSEIERSLKACAQTGAVLVVNDYWQAALEVGAAWVHLGQEDLQQADREALAQAGIKLGLSTHDPDELETALVYQPDYVALGPVWPTTLKAMRWSPQGLERVRDWARRAGDVPLVAIGGLNRERAQMCLEAGAQAVAMVSGVFRTEDPAREARLWVEMFEQAPAHQEDA